MKDYEIKVVLKRSKTKNVVNWYISQEEINHNDLCYLLNFVRKLVDNMEYKIFTQSIEKGKGI